MTCMDVNGMLDRLMDGELTEDERRELEAHAQSCEKCAGEIKATLQMKALFEEMEPEVDVPLAAQAKWRGAVREAARQDRKKRLTRWIGSAAAAVVVLVGVGLALNGSIAPGKDAAAPMATELREELAAGADMANGADMTFEAEADAVMDEAAEVEYANEAAADAPVVEVDGDSAARESESMALGAFEAGTMKAAAPETTNMPADLSVEDVFDAEAAVEAAEPMEPEGAGADAPMEQAEAAPMSAALPGQSPACELSIRTRSVETACDIVCDLAGEFEGVADVQAVEGGSANVYVEIDAQYAAEFLSGVVRLDESQSRPGIPALADEGTVFVLLEIQPLEE